MFAPNNSNSVDFKFIVVYDKFNKPVAINTYFLQKYVFTANKNCSIKVPKYLGTLSLPYIYCGVYTLSSMYFSGSRKKSIRFIIYTPSSFM